MSSTKNITPGTAEYIPNNRSTVGLYVNGKRVGETSVDEEEGRDALIEQVVGNARLYAEAHNIANQTGFSPKELMEQRDEAVRLLKRMMLRIEFIEQYTEGKVDPTDLTDPRAFLKSLSTT